MALYLCLPSCPLPSPPPASPLLSAPPPALICPLLLPLPSPACPSLPWGWRRRRRTWAALMRTRFTFGGIPARAPRLWQRRRRGVPGRRRGSGRGGGRAAPAARRPLLWAQRNPRACASLRQKRHSGGGWLAGWLSAAAAAAYAYLESPWNLLGGARLVACSVCRAAAEAGRLPLLAAPPLAQQGEGGGGPVGRHGDNQHKLLLIV